MQIKAYAKINLCLDVLKKEKKYHRIRTVLQQIGLHDVVTVKETDAAGIAIECDVPGVPLDRRNTVYKAALIMKQYAGQAGAKDHVSKKGLLIKIQKDIPVASGLGGASSDAAAVMNALNKIWKLKLTPARLRVLAAEIGMDTPFFISGGTALGTHYGEKIRPLAPIKMPPFLIAIDGQKKSTVEMYHLLDLKKTGRKKDLTEYFVGSLKKNKSLTQACRNFHNDFETVLFHKKMASTRQLYKKLLRSGASVVLMSGSGPAICSLYKNEDTLNRAYENLAGKVRFLWK